MHFRSLPVAEHCEVPLADDGQWEQLAQPERPETSNGVYVVSVSPESDPLVQQAQLREICQLVQAQGNPILGQEIRRIHRSDPRTLLGSGACREVGARARQLGASMLVMDAELSPSQMRNLEEMVHLPVADREGIILNVFLRHARTRRARVQVEIARLDYLRPRIRGMGLDMDQQMGGVTGSRGPGETASELLARKLDRRLAELKKLETKFQRSELQQRQNRSSIRKIALVGYTNAGKTSLMNALTRETLSARDRPFETLDTTSRRLHREVVISDTVGFIRRLPARLFSSFASTLSELREADLLLLVVDISDYEWRSHLHTTLDLLEQLGADGIPRQIVYNKADLLESEPILEHPGWLLSSLDHQAVCQLKQHLLKRVAEWRTTQTLFIPYSAEPVLRSIYRDCQVLESKPNTHGLRLKLQAEQSVFQRLRRQLKELAHDAS